MTFYVKLKTFEKKYIHHTKQNNILYHLTEYHQVGTDRFKSTHLYTHKNEYFPVFSFRLLSKYTAQNMKTFLLQGFTWWCHQMETFSALLALCAGTSPVPGEFRPQRPVTQSFDVFFDLRLNKRLSKQSWGWWFETPSRPLWRHRNDFGDINSSWIFVSYSLKCAYIERCWQNSMN